MNTKGEIRTEFVRKLREQDNSNHDGLLILLRESGMQLFCIAWRNVGAFMDDNDLPDGELTLGDCWAHCQYDQKLLSTLYGKTHSYTQEKLERCKAFGLIFPDGSLSKQAETVLKGVTAKELKGFKQ